MFQILSLEDRNMRTTVILNLKGGVAKTATTVNVAAILAKDRRGAAEMYGRL